jgi:hypothetical protein
MKRNLSIVCFLALLAFVTEVGAVSVNANVNAQVNTGAGNASTSMSATGTVQSQNKGNATSTIKSGGSQGDANRSDVATFVRNLLSIADRDGGIGAEVRLVAQEHASTSDQVKEDKEEVESENGLKVFILGPDYKSLGELRSSIVTTENHIERLKRAQDKTLDASVKADLEVEIQALMVEASTTEAFVVANESKLSLLGWFVKLFSK